ncbi:MAG TPA: hypothetical protein VFW94_07885 [Candidatus Acidoferrales bacterium]|nr:hypothetical protein [Candidatus Acidoferrales bacterium]
MRQTVTALRSNLKAWLRARNRYAVMWILLATCALPVALPRASSARQRSNGAQGSKCPTSSASDTIYELWNMAASGRLLNRRGWEFAARYYFSKPSPWSSDGSFQVVTDYWTVTYDRCAGDTLLGKVLGDDEAVVSVISHWGRKPGLIDSELRFTPPPQSSVYETGIGYHLVLTTLDVSTSPGETPQKRWRIQGPPPPPFATVTAAIRYVLERRAETKDPMVRKNADETLAQLLKLH